MPRVSSTARASANDSLFLPEEPPTPQKHITKPEPKFNEEDDSEGFEIGGDESDDGEVVSSFNIQETLPTPTTTRRRLSYLLGERFTLFLNICSTAFHTSR